LRQLCFGNSKIRIEVATNEFKDTHPIPVANATPMRFTACIPIIFVSSHSAALRMPKVVESGKFYHVDIVNGRFDCGEMEARTPRRKNDWVVNEHQPRQRKDGNVEVHLINDRVHIFILF
jgi:hypothetical protein